MNFVNMHEIQAAILIASFFLHELSVLITSNKRLC